MKHNKTSWPDQNKHNRLLRIASFPLVKASSLDLQHSRRRLRTDLSLLVVEVRPFCKETWKRSLLHRNYKSSIQHYREHAAAIAQKQWRQGFLFTWRTPDKNKPSDWSVLSLNRPRAWLLTNQVTGTCWYIIIYSKCAKT